MSNKTFCDGCDRLMAGSLEINHYSVEVSVKRHDKGGRIKLGVRLTEDSEHDICRYCIADAFASLDDRPKVGQAVPATTK